MKIEKITLEKKLLVGIKTRTNNKNEFSGQDAKIPNIMNHYFGNNLSSKINDKKDNNQTFCVYHEYENKKKGEDGNYSYLIGEEVTLIKDIEENIFSYIEIPSQDYIKFTSNNGKMPDVVIELWQEIWRTNFSEFNCERSYIADFEIYDEKSSDPENTIVEIYIGVRSY